jgi:nucleoside transporter
MSNDNSASVPTLRLWLMMCLQFAIYGAWLPKVFGYLGQLGFTPGQQTAILAAFPVAAIVAMFFGNQLADRRFAAEKFLAFSHLVGGLALLGLAWAKSFWPFMLLMAVHAFFYVPTISITNAIAFSAMKDARKEFGIVRMGGTIGWIAVAWPFTFLLTQFDASICFLVGGVLALVLAAYSLTLPHTPPKPKVEGEGQAWIEALRMLAAPAMLVLWLVTFIDAAIHQAFFVWTDSFLSSAAVGIPARWTMVVMSLGQIAEILTMLVLGRVLAALGWKATLIIGVLGHALRFAVFAFLPESQWLVIAVMAVHGICYAFFFATVYIFVEEYAPKSIRASAQGLFNLMILGLGPLAATALCPRLFEAAKSPLTQAVDYRSLFIMPMLAALVAAAILLVAFWPPRHAAGADARTDG